MAKIIRLTAAQLLLLQPEQRRYEEHLRLAQQHRDAAAEAANTLVRTAAFAFGCAAEQVNLSRLHEGAVLIDDGIVAEPEEAT